MKLEISRAELYRYLGYGGTLPDERTREEAEDCLRELMSAVRPRFFSREYPLILRPDFRVDASCFLARSESLWKNLEGCEAVLLFAATLGMGVDLLLRRYSSILMSRTVILQAAGTAAIEAFCDQENRRLKKEYKNRGCDLRPRFSPGYGDLPLSVQPELLRALEGEKHAGITLTDSLAMIPSKSVTAVIGIRRSEESATRPADGCGACGQKDCLYKKDGVSHQSEREL